MRAGQVSESFVGRRVPHRKEDFMAHRSPHERPSQYDGTQFVIFVDLPDRAFVTADLYPHVCGVRPGDGAKPWALFRDAQSNRWGTLSVPAAFPVAALAWMVPLDQAARRSGPLALGGSNDNDNLWSLSKPIA
jgi:hypothetical protein